MGTNPFFNKFNEEGEQELLDSLMVESIQVFGQDMLYLPRRRRAFDGVYYQDDISMFDTTYPIEVYIKSVDGFQQPSFMSKFGLEIRNELVFSMAMRTFENVVTEKEPEVLRPREGDLIYFPLNEKLFEIKYVNTFVHFYQLGGLRLYDLTCELYEYSGEAFKTGIDEVDVIQEKFSFNYYDWAFYHEDGSVMKHEDGTIYAQEELDHNTDEFDPLRDNDRIEEEEDAGFEETVLDWSSDNPFSEEKY